MVGEAPGSIPLGAVTEKKHGSLTSELIPDSRVFDGVGGEEKGNGHHAL